MNLTNLQIKRNDKCPCGSNKKYKKCCEITLEIISDHTFSKKVKGNLVDRPFDKKNTIKWRTSISKLPIEIQKTIKKYLNESSVVEYGCYYNSSHLSILDKRIKTIHGWYGTKIPKEEIHENEEFFKNRKSKRKFRDFQGEQIIDFENKIIYSPHTWNEYNGIYFDLSTEGNDTFNNWVYYNKVESVDFGQFISNELVENFYTQKLHRIKSGFSEKRLNKILFNLLQTETTKYEEVYN